LTFELDLAIIPKLIMTEAYQSELNRAQITPIKELTNRYELDGLANLTGTTREGDLFSSEDGLSFTLTGVRPEAVIDGNDRSIALYDGVIVANETNEDKVAVVVLPDLIEDEAHDKPKEIRIVDLVRGELYALPSEKAAAEIIKAHNLANKQRDESLGDWAQSHYPRAKRGPQGE
jgi:hypothetical protein